MYQDVLDCSFGFLTFFCILEKGKEREILVRCFLYVSRPVIKPETFSVYGMTLQSAESHQPGPVSF